MYEQLKSMMPHADIFYGPVTKDQAFNVPQHSYAVPVGNQWYIGVNKEMSEYQSIAIAKPPAPPQEEVSEPQQEQQP